MKVTALEPQKKNKKRLNLYVNGNFVAGINAGTAASLGLFEGKEIEEGTLDELSSEESYQLCLAKAFDLIAIRMQSEHELWQKLGKKFVRKDIGAVIARLKTLGYVDDRQFAHLWIESRSYTRGRNMLRPELIKKGIQKDIIDEILGEIVPENEVLAAKNAIRTKDKIFENDEERFKKLGSLLARRGFSYDIIKKALAQEE